MTVADRLFSFPARVAVQLETCGQRIADDAEGGPQGDGGPEGGPGGRAGARVPGGAGGRVTGELSEGQIAQLRPGFHRVPALGTGGRYRFGQIARAVYFGRRQAARVGQGHRQVEEEGGVQQWLQPGRHLRGDEDGRVVLRLPGRHLLVGSCMDQAEDAQALEIGDERARFGMGSSVGDVENEKNAGTIFFDQRSALHQGAEAAIVEIEGQGDNLGEFLNF